MKRDLMDILACPVCKGPLTLTVEEEDTEKGEIIKGSLFCPNCNETYPIEDSIPNLLPPELRNAAV
ncbi:MAG TPA: methytransferase partner Trm112 [Dehalococcoidia bacterium]|nr:methytransferase partner Trm112 [Dehalococcoidia bacterium]